MAVYAAHLTRTLAGTPSIFEITAQEQLASTVRPALKKLVEFLASYNPGKLNWLVKWYDEVYLVFNSILQYHYLKHYAASFSESFYGLRRVPTYTPEFTDGFHLPHAAERASLLILVLLPYVRSKLENLVEKCRINWADGIRDKSWKGKLQEALVHTYTLLHFSLESLTLAFSLAYMSNRSRTATPLLGLARVSLAYTVDAVRDDEHTWGELVRSFVNKDFSSMRLTFNMIGGAILRGMEVGAFVVQFLKWWESSHTYMPALPAVPYPELDEKADRLLGKCPVCLQQWRIPTALPVSGYVFCYKCITRELKDRGVCPVSKYPASEQDLIRLYLDQ